MRLVARPESHSRCRSVAEGNGTRQISVLSITAQDENESMAPTPDHKPDWRIKHHFRTWKCFHGYKNTGSGMPVIGKKWAKVETHQQFNFKEKSFRFKISLLRSFIGCHASIFTLAGSIRCLCLTVTVSPHQDPVGSTPAMT